MPRPGCGSPGALLCHYSAPVKNLRLRRVVRAPALSLSKRREAALLQVDGLVMPGFVELCTPHPVHALVIGPVEDHGSAQPNVEIV